MSTTTKQPAYTWRVVDIVVAAVIAVACGVIFWLWDQAYAGVEAATAASRR